MVFVFFCSVATADTRKRVKLLLELELFGLQLLAEPMKDQ